MNTLSSLFALCFLFITASSSFGYSPLPPSTLDFSVVDAIARASIRQQVKALNQELAQALEEETSDRFLEALLRQGSSRIHPHYLDAKCAYQQRHLEAMLDHQLSELDDQTVSQSQSLETIQRLYGKKVWKLLSYHCTEAALHFERRLQELNVDSESAAELSRFVFYPTWAGRPNLKKSLLKALQLIVSSAMFLGTSSSLLGLPVGKLILTHTLPVHSALQLRQLYQTQQGGIELPRLEVQLNSEELLIYQETH